MLVATQRCLYPGLAGGASNNDGGFQVFLRVYSSRVSLVVIIRLLFYLSCIERLASSLAYLFSAAGSLISIPNFLAFAKSSADSLTLLAEPDVDRETPATGDCTLFCSKDTIFLSSCEVFLSAVCCGFIKSGKYFDILLSSS